MNIWGIAAIYCAGLTTGTALAWVYWATRITDLARAINGHGRHRTHNTKEQP